MPPEGVFVGNACVFMRSTFSAFHPWYGHFGSADVVLFGKADDFWDLLLGSDICPWDGGTLISIPG